MNAEVRRIIGVDPGLQRTGWGIIEARSWGLTFIACGVVKSNSADLLYRRLALLDAGLTQVIAEWRPAAAAVEETFMNNNAASALKLGQARGAVIVALARGGLEVAEYAANLVKKSLTGSGHAGKEQMAAMVRVLLPASGVVGGDTADALAVAICHAHHAQTLARLRV